MNDELLSRIAVAATTELVKQPLQVLINTWIKPKMEDFKKRKEVDDLLEEHVLGTFSEYIIRTSNKYEILNILALGNREINIEQIYQPLTIIDDVKNEEFFITEYPLEVTNLHKKVLIEDNAGMGKSTILKKMFISSLDMNVGIPIFIELRKLTDKIGIIELILENINPINAEHNKEYILELIKKGDFIFFLDGYDEISFEYKEQVTNHLNTFISKANENVFLLTSRSDPSLTSFGQFYKYRIKQLNANEAFDLLRKYDEVTNLNLGSGIIGQIEEHISSGYFEDITSFLGNPLLVTLIYVTYKHKRDIPIKKDEFYRKVYDALYAEHDLSKDSFRRNKYSVLSSEKLHKILRKLGFLCVVGSKFDFSKDSILKLINDAKDSIYFENVQDEDVLNDILYTVPLFLRDGLSYKWAHKSFAEYFAANYIYFDKGNEKEKILNKIMASRNFNSYINMLDLYYDIDQEIFDRELTYPLIKEFIEYMEADITDLKEFSIKLKELLFNSLYYIENKEKELFPKDISIDERVNLIGKLREEIEANINKGRDDIYHTISGSYSRYSIGLHFIKNQNKQALFELLHLKGNNYVDYIEYILEGEEREELAPTNNSCSIYSMENANQVIKNITEEGIQELMELFGAFFHDVFYLKYDAAKKYKEKMEMQFKKNELDLFNEF